MEGEGAEHGLVTSDQAITGLLLVVAVLASALLVQLTHSPVPAG